MTVAITVLLTFLALALAAHFGHWGEFRCPKGWPSEHRGDTLICTNPRYAK